MKFEQPPQTNEEEKMTKKLEMPNVPDFQGKLDALNFAAIKNPREYVRAIAEYEAMARGEDPSQLREHYYPDWKDEDFQSLLDHHRKNFETEEAYEEITKKEKERWLEK